MQIGESFKYLGGGCVVYAIMAACSGGGAGGGLLMDAGPDSVTSVPDGASGMMGMGGFIGTDAAGDRRMGAGGMPGMDASLDQGVGVGGSMLTDASPDSPMGVGGAGGMGVGGSMLADASPDTSVGVGGMILMDASSDGIGMAGMMPGDASSDRGIMDALTDPVPDVHAQDGGSCATCVIAGGTVTSITADTDLNQLAGFTFEGSSSVDFDEVVGAAPVQFGAVHVATGPLIVTDIASNGSVSLNAVAVGEACFEGSSIGTPNPNARWIGTGTASHVAGARLVVRSGEYLCAVSRFTGAAPALISLSFFRPY